MKKILKAGLLYSCILLFSIPSQAQSDTLLKEPALNVVYVQFGILGLGANYERTIHNWEKSHLNLRTGVGSVLTFILEPGLNVYPSLQFITGKKWFHFEAGLGINLIFVNHLQEFEPLPLIHAGLRIEPPDKGPVIRMGVGLENSLFSFSLGWKF